MEEEEAARAKESVTSANNKTLYLQIFTTDPLSNTSTSVTDAGAALSNTSTSVTDAGVALSNTSTSVTDAGAALCAKTASQQSDDFQPWQVIDQLLWPIVAALDPLPTAAMTASLDAASELPIQYH